MLAGVDRETPQGENRELAPAPVLAADAGPTLRAFPGAARALLRGSLRPARRGWSAGRRVLRLRVLRRVGVARRASSAGTAGCSTPATAPPRTSPRPSRSRAPSSRRGGPRWSTRRTGWRRTASPTCSCSRPTSTRSIRSCCRRRCDASAPRRAPTRSCATCATHSTVPVLDLRPAPARRQEQGARSTTAPTRTGTTAARLPRRRRCCGCSRPRLAAPVRGTRRLRRARGPRRAGSRPGRHAGDSECD